MIFFSIPEKTNPLLQVYLYFEVPAGITGDHDSNCKEVVLSHLLLGDDPHDGPLGGRGAEPALQLLLLKDALRLLGGGGLVSHGQAAAWEGTKVTQQAVKAGGSPWGTSPLHLSGPWSLVSARGPALYPEVQERHVHRQPGMAKTPLQPSTALSGLLSLDPERRNLQEQPQLLQLWVLALLRGMDISLVPPGSSATPVGIYGLFSSPVWTCVCGRRQVNQPCLGG